MSANIQTLTQWVAQANNIVFFGGAGVSTESGIPDFRSTDGLYHQSYDYPPETILSHTFFQTHPAEFFQFYRDNMLYSNVKPNAAHQKLAQWEKDGKLLSIITQNIDGLHQKAGNSKVLELHGSVHRNYCQICGRFYPLERVQADSGIPHCECGGIIKPDVVLYEERLKDSILEQSIEAIQTADLLIVAGTSLTVYPAAGLLNAYLGNQLVLINRSSTKYDQSANLLIGENIAAVMQQLP